MPPKQRVISEFPDRLRQGTCTFSKRAVRNVPANNPLRPFRLLDVQRQISVSSDRMVFLTKDKTSINPNLGQN